MGRANLHPVMGGAHLHSAMGGAHLHSAMGGAHLHPVMGGAHLHPVTGRALAWKSRHGLRELLCRCKPHPLTFPADVPDTRYCPPLAEGEGLGRMEEREGAST